MLRSASARRTVLALTACGVLVSGGVAWAGADSDDAPPTAWNFHKLRTCESGNDYRANTGNGYYGAYQFDAQTWHGLGYRGRADQAPAARQDRAARRLYDERGWDPWPSCAEQEGLS